MEQQPELRVMPVLSEINKHTGLRSKSEAMSQEMPNVTDHLQEVAVALEEKGESSQELRNKLKAMLEKQADLKAHVKALGELEQSYKCTLDSFDFAGFLKDKTAQLRHGVTVEQGMLDDFDKAVWEVKNKDVPIPGGDEDVILTSQALQTNSRCPMSAKPVDQLEEPVMDQKGYVYEKKLIEQFIRAKGGRVPCPQAGAGHVITLNDLKPARHIERARKRAKYTGQSSTQPTQGGGGAEEINLED